MNAMDIQQRLESLKALAVVERYTRSVRFEDSLKFYAPIVG